MIDFVCPATPQTKILHISSSPGDAMDLRSVHRERVLVVSLLRFIITGTIPHLQF